MTALRQIAIPFLDRTRLARSPSLAAERAEAARFRSAVAAALAGWNREQILLRGELELIRYRAERAEARAEAVESSLLWRAAAPLRRWAARLPGRAPAEAAPGRPGLARRLRRAAGPGRVGIKGVARMAFYATAGAFLRLPGTAALFDRSLRVFPGPGIWLALRYRAYRRAAWRGPPPAERHRPDTARPRPAEEQRMLLSLRARRIAA